MGLKNSGGYNPVATGSRSIGKLLQSFRSRDAVGDIRVNTKVRTNKDNPNLISGSGGTTDTTSRTGWTIHTFTTSTPAPESTFEISGAPPSWAFDVLIIGGGGGGAGPGGSPGGSGGGGGGVVERIGMTGLSGTYPISVGAGGAVQPTPNSRGNTGSDSSFGSPTDPNYMVAKGGGGGGIYYDTSNLQGGSGGGAGRDTGTSFGEGIQPTEPTVPADSRTYGFGADGGAAGGTGWSSSGGGGGAGGPGEQGRSPDQDVQGHSGGYGGYGHETIIDGSRATYAGGGGGSSYSGQPGRGGRGGGSNGGSQGGGAAGGGPTNFSNPGSDSRNAGGYGSGGGGGYPTFDGGSGSDGLVKIAYKTDITSPYSTLESVTGGDASYTVGTRTVKVFTGPGTFAAPAGTDEICYFMVGGGGAGGADGGGGGGGGGVVMGSYQVSGPISMAVTIGEGGTGSPRNVGPQPGEMGTPSTLVLSPTVTKTAGGGGVGGKYLNPAGEGYGMPGVDGGCGGGGRGNQSTANGGSCPDTSQGAPGHRANGGPCPAGGESGIGGGGGGAGEGFILNESTSSRKKEGGDGARLPSIFLSPTNQYGGSRAPTQTTIGGSSSHFYFGGGGGGSGNTDGSSGGEGYGGGAGGGSPGGPGSGYDATANSGGGGGASNGENHPSNPNLQGGTGGDGIVFIAYTTPS